jgi:hypothetical protein
VYSAAKNLEADFSSLSDIKLKEFMTSLYATAFISE